MRKVILLCTTTARTPEELSFSFISIVDKEIARELDINGKQDTLSFQCLNENSISEDTENLELAISEVGDSGKRYNIKMFTLCKFIHYYSEFPPGRSGKNK